MNEIGLRLEALDLSVGGRELFAGFSLAVAPGEVVTVMGPSGCGKSSLLSWLCGTLDPVFRATGRIWLNGAAIEGLPPERRRLGILFQDDMLFPHLSVGENLAFALPRAVRSRRERRAKVAAALREADLEGFADRDPATLSGGQRARVALMRTLLAEPRALLLDEPFNKLDRDLRLRVRRFVFDHARGMALPTLLVTHDSADAEAASGPVVSLPDEPAAVDVTTWRERSRRLA
jgi:putative thiamine transport system ATP-binding protein